MKNLIRRMVKWALADNDASSHLRGTPAPIGSAKVRHRISIGDSINGMNFTIYSAIGGKVVQFNSYDPIRDRNEAHLYIVTDKEDLGVELGQIITREALSNGRN